jgi:hypothetical protein
MASARYRDAASEHPRTHGLHGAVLLAGRDCQLAPAMAAPYVLSRRIGGVVVRYMGNGAVKPLPKATPAVCPNCEGALLYLRESADAFRCGNCQRNHTFQSIKAGQGHAAAQAAATSPSIRSLR